MPPVNTPTISSPTATRSPSRPQTPTTTTTRPLTPLSYLSSPAPDLASTLYTSHADEQADEANIAFLRDSIDLLESLPADRTSWPSSRARVDAQRDPRRAEYAPSSSAAATGSRGLSATQPRQYRETPEDLSRRERLQRVLARLNRLHEPATSSAAAYSNRTPSPNRQSLYDWAPAHDEPGDEGEGELDAVLSELRRQQPDTHPGILRILGQSQVDSRQERREQEREMQSAGASSTTAATNAADAEQRRSLLRDRDRRRREMDSASLRSRAVLQRARQEDAGSPSSTERMLRYVMERERSGMSEEEERARGTGWFRASPSRGSGEENINSAERWLSTHASSDLQERYWQERVNAFRRGSFTESDLAPRLPRTSTPPVPPNDRHGRSKPTFVEHALRYLSDLRSSTCYEDALSAAITHGLATKEFFADKHDDFVMDLGEIPTIQPSSWLQPGAVFEGHQHASTAVATLTHQSPTAHSRVEQINPNYRSSPGPTLGFDHPPGSTQVSTFDATRPWLSHHPPTSMKPPHDQWPVRVTLHTVDLAKMTLQGTMEAYDVPQHPPHLSILASADRPKAGKKHQPITTYLEGHIIDLRTHTFLTPDTRSEQKRKTGPHPTNPANRTPYTTLQETTAFPSATPPTDAANWLKLPPFTNLTSTSAGTDSTGHNPSSTPEDAFARLLLSHTNIAALLNEYVFMRWKERCFVHARNDPCSAPECERGGDQDRGHGLTISGFYYVSLRREDGRVEGLYFDPVSTPHQCLRLQGKGGGVGGWEFR